MTFGEKLRSWRKAKGMTQPELAVASGVNVSYISNLERNFSANKKGKPQPSRELCHKFAKVLGVAETDMLLAAGYAPLNSAYPQTEAEFIEALKEYGICNFQVPKEDIDKLGPEFFQSILEFFRHTVKGKILEGKEAKEKTGEVLSKTRSS
jgi:transcriptional regulator with XRE-family HTH domain